MKINMTEQYGLARTSAGIKPSYNGILEFIIKSAHTGEIVDHIQDHNLVKIFAKEILAHRLAPTNIWDPTANTGEGAWVASGIDPDEDFSAKYIIFGASFDENGAPLDSADTRYYIVDTVTNTSIPIQLGVGAEYDGGLINAIPISEPLRPLKKVERVFFEPTYQPSGTPLLQDDVRAMNNVVVLETTLRKEEYNGFNLTDADYFTITEVALAGGKQLDAVGDCECDPADLFLEGRTDRSAISVNATGTATVTIDPDDISYTDVIKEGDQVQLVDVDDTAAASLTLDQVNNHFLVISKSVGGSDIELDRTPTDSDGNPITGQIGIFKNTLRIFSHRVLKTPFKKSADYEICCRWRIILG